MSKLLDDMNALAAEISVCRDCMLHLTRDKSVPGESFLKLIQSEPGLIASLLQINEGFVIYRFCIEYVRKRNADL